MTIVSVKSGADEELRRVELSDGSFFSFKIYYLPPVYADESCFSPGIADGLEISPAEEQGFRFASACLRAEKAALQLIARAEQNMSGLSRKLKKRGHDSDCIDAVIARLCETGLVDDRRYARLWLESRINRQVSSPFRLRAALRARNIDRHDAEAVLKEALDDEAEQQLLERYVQKRQRTQKSDDARHSLRYILRNEGFSSSAIQCFFDTRDCNHE